jgi:rhodanese-related sulfurtransferase
MKKKLIAGSLGLAATLVLLIAAYAGPGTNDLPSNAAKTVPKSGGARRVGVEEFEKLWQDKNPVLDVRSQKEFDAGHIPGAVNLDVNSPEFIQKVSALDKKKVYLVHCAAGVRSARACQKMSELGFEHLIDLAPGFRGWEKAGKKVEK